ncbi:hypothetical protein [Parasitella parasitica]|uniref:Uncharacterized protein n=1 Tax=Parasitella parasitica TaxID=35722 RepID=A0A0B7NQL8_9FUNG|nr:hypothetical protein [Parasitella parasitica]
MLPTRGRKLTISHLTEQEIFDLTPRFETYRKNITCNGTQSGNPPQPTFVCKKCSKTHNARTVYDILNRMDATTHGVVASPIETSGSFESVENIETLRELITQLREELKQTQLELQQARSEITQLREQQHQHE